MASIKARLFTGIRGDVVEIGPGCGANLPYLAGRVHSYTAIEPNVFMHGRLRLTAEEHRVPMRLREADAAAMPLETGSADAVVCTLVLCSVPDVAVVLRDVLRVLRPGGTFVFLEHVAAPAGTWLRFAQGAVRPVWRWAGDGCEPNRETGRAIESAGFAGVNLEHVRVRAQIIAPHIAGTAIR